MPKTIEEIYNDYQIMPNLREHMYRVASVASILCDHFSGTIDRKSVLQVCLLHDMGKIVTLELGKFPEFLEPEGKEHWQKVKEEFIKKYGTENEHDITLKIAEDVGTSLRALEILNSMGFTNAINVLESNEFEKKICLYSDMRASPLFVVALSERLADLNERYEKDPTEILGKNREELINAINKIEKEIFEKIKIIPSFIDEKNVQNIIPHLKNIHIH